MLTRIVGVSGPLLVSMINLERRATRLCFGGINFAVGFGWSTLLDRDRFVGATSVGSLTLLGIIRELLL